MASKKREHLVETARRLFYRDGFHATGIDAILAEAGVAKMTLYKHFKSKEELILAALERQGEWFRTWIAAGVERRARQPADRLLALFDALEEWFRSEAFFGCAFIKAAGEFPSLENPIHQIAMTHQQMVHSYIRGLAADAGARDPDALACQLCLLVGGAVVNAQPTGQCDAARQARAAAEVLIRAASPDAS